MDASKRIGDLIVISQRLADLLTRENQALRGNHPDEVQALLDQKEELSRAYESRIAGLAEHANGAAMDAVDPPLKDRLRSLGEEILILSEENTVLLKVAMEVNRRVLHEVAEAVNTSRSSQTSYSNKGTPGHQARRGASRNVAISLDESL